MSERLNKQGVRDLNPSGFNGRTLTKHRCRHFYGPTVKIGERWEADDDYFGEACLVPVYGRLCMHCGEHNGTY